MSGLLDPSKEGAGALDSGVLRQRSLGQGLAFERGPGPAEGAGSWAPCCAYSTWVPWPFWVGGGAGGHTLGRLCPSPPVYGPRLLLALATLSPSPPAAQRGGAQKRSGRGECTVC